MFTYLRYFSAISFVVVVAAAILVGIYFRSTAANDLKMVVEQNNISLEQGFQNTVWRRYRRLFTEILSNTDVKQWPQDKYFIQFSREAFRYFEGIKVAKINIYTASGDRFLSTDQSEIILFQKESGSLFGGKDKDSSDVAALEAVKNGNVFSRIIPEGGFKGADGNMRRGSLVQTYIPILSDSYVPVVADNSSPKIEGFMEVFFDITPQYRQLDQFQMVGTSGIIIIFITLFAALILTARRAETIIAKQHDKTLELTAAKARAEAENMEKSRFLANISHELRTPLNAIIGFSEIVKTQSLGPVGNTQYVEYVSDIHSSGVHLLSLINDILDYSKAEAGKLELEISELDAKKMVKTCLRLVQTRADEAKVKLVEKVPEDHFVLNTDAKKLKQILLNLLSNAVKFTPENGTVTVTAWHNVIDDTYSIEVRDTGIGIAPKDISKAMSPFGQVDSELSRKYEGTGLGLPLTKKFTEVMGGVFNIQSEIGVGTTITITLPKFPPANSIKKGSNTSSGNTKVDTVEVKAPVSAPLPKVPEPALKTSVPPPVLPPMPSPPSRPMVEEGVSLTQQPPRLPSAGSIPKPAVLTSPSSPPAQAVTNPDAVQTNKIAESEPAMVAGPVFHDAPVPLVTPVLPKPAVSSPFTSSPSPDAPKPAFQNVVVPPAASAPQFTNKPVAAAVTPPFPPPPPPPQVAPKPAFQNVAVPPAIPPIPPKPATPAALPAFPPAAPAIQAPISTPAPFAPPPASATAPNPFSTSQTPAAAPKPALQNVAAPPAIPPIPPKPATPAAPPAFPPAAPAIQAPISTPAPNPFSNPGMTPPPPKPTLQPVYPQAAPINPPLSMPKADIGQPPQSGPVKTELSLAPRGPIGQTPPPPTLKPEEDKKS